MEENLQTAFNEICASLCGSLRFVAYAVRCELVFKSIRFRKRLKHVQVIFLNIDFI